MPVTRAQKLDGHREHVVSRGSMASIAVAAERATTRNRTVALVIVAGYCISMAVFCGLVASDPAAKSMLVVNGGSSDSCHGSSKSSFLWPWSARTPMGGADTYTEEAVSINFLHWVTSGMFTSIIIVEIVASIVVTDSSKAQVNTLVIAVASMAATTYYLMATGVAPILVASNGRVFYPTRVLTWVWTTSTLIFSMWQAGTTSVSYLVNVWAANVAMLGSGAVGYAFNGWKMWLSFWVSTILFLINGVYMWYLFGSTEGGSPRERRSVMILKNIIVTVWCSFPVVFLLEFTPMSSFVLELLTVLGDLGAKAIALSATQSGVIMAASDRKQGALMQMAVDLVEDLREEDKRKEKYLSIIAGEFGIPIKEIVSMVDSVASNNNLNERVVKALSTISKKGQQLHGRVQDIMDTAAVQSNRMVLETQSVKISTIIDEVVILIEPLLKGSVKLGLQVQKGLPPLEADPARLSQLLFNLARAAADSCKYSKIQFSASLIGNEVMRVEVQESGELIQSSPSSDQSRAHRRALSLL